MKLVLLAMEEEEGIIILLAEATFIEFSEVMELIEWMGEMLSI